MSADALMCACRHTRASHDMDGCPACAGPPCDEAQRLIERAYWAGLEATWRDRIKSGDARGACTCGTNTNGGNK